MEQVGYILLLGRLSIKSNLRRKNEAQIKKRKLTYYS